MSDLVRCVVCGAETRTPAELVARNPFTGELIDRQPEPGYGRFPDGAVAGACAHHTDDEVVAAERLHHPWLEVDA